METFSQTVSRRQRESYVSKHPEAGGSIELLKYRKGRWVVCSKKRGKCYKTRLAVNVVARSQRPYKPCKGY